MSVRTIAALTREEDVAFDLLPPTLAPQPASTHADSEHVYRPPRCWGGKTRSLITLAADGRGRVQGKEDA